MDSDIHLRKTNRSLTAVYNPRGGLTGSHGNRTSLDSSTIGDRYHGNQSVTAAKRHSLVFLNNNEETSKYPSHYTLENNVPEEQESSEKGESRDRTESTTAFPAAGVSCKHFSKNEAINSRQCLRKTSRHSRYSSYSSDYSESDRWVNLRKESSGAGGGVVFKRHGRLTSRGEPVLARSYTQPPRVDAVCDESGRGSAVMRKTAEAPLLRFRSVVRTVICLLRATRNERHKNKQTEEKLLTFAHYQDEILNTRRSNYGDGLSFDPLQYRALREITVSNEAKAILSLPPECRSVDQLHVALLSLQTAVDAFCEFPIKMQNSLVKRGWYEHFENKRVIIRQGHTADNFYMILSGTAVVTKVENAAKEAKVTTVAVLDKGNTFGEVAIMKASTRSATVTCKGDVELLAVSRDDFIDIFMHVESSREPEHIAYLRTLDYLSKWPLHKLPWDEPKICLFTYFRRGTVMCRDLDNSEWIYVIKTGSCRVLTTLRETRPTLPSLGKPQRQRHAVRLTKKQRQQQSQSGASSMENVSLGAESATTPTSVSDMLQNNAKDFTSFPALKQLKTFTEDELLRLHKKRLDEISKEVAAIRLRRGRPISTKKSEAGHDLFVQLAQLGPKASFGLEPVTFGVLTKRRCISLVSDGAEAILINRKFFVQNTTEQYWRKLRMTLQPYPSDASLQEKLQDESNWRAFKERTFSTYTPSQRRPHRYVPAVR